MIVIVEDGDCVRSLEDLNFKIPEDVRHRFVHAHGIRVRERDTGLGDLPSLLDDLSSGRLQDRTGVIADKQIRVAGAGGCALRIHNRPWTRERRLETEHRVGPNGAVKSGIKGAVCEAAPSAPLLNLGACAGAGEVAAAAATTDEIKMKCRSFKAMCPSLRSCPLVGSRLHGFRMCRQEQGAYTKLDTRANLRSRPANMSTSLGRKHNPTSRYVGKANRRSFRAFTAIGLLDPKKRFEDAAQMPPRLIPRAYLLPMPPRMMAVDR
jgi:hypothetical protein